MPARRNVLPLLGVSVGDKGVTGDGEISAICKVQLILEEQEEEGG